MYSIANNNRQVCNWKENFIDNHLQCVVPLKNFLRVVKKQFYNEFLRLLNIKRLLCKNTACITRNKHDCNAVIHNTQLYAISMFIPFDSMTKIKTDKRHSISRDILFSIEIVKFCFTVLLLSNMVSTCLACFAIFVCLYCITSMRIRRTEWSLF